MLSLDEKRLYVVLGEKIRAVRIAAGLSQDDLASQLGLLRTSITNIEAGKQKPTLSAIYRMSGVLHVNLIDLLPPMEEYVQRGLFDYLEQEDLPDLKLTNDVLNKYRGEL